MMQERIDELERLLAEAYQVVSVLAEDAGRWSDTDVQQMMDNLAEMKFVHENVLPFESKPTEARVMFDKGWDGALDLVENIAREMERQGCETAIDDSTYKMVLKKGMRMSLGSLIDRVKSHMTSS